MSPGFLAVKMGGEWSPPPGYDSLEVRRVAEEVSC